MYTPRAIALIKYSYYDKTVIAHLANLALRMSNGLHFIINLKREPHGEV